MTHPWAGALLAGGQSARMQRTKASVVVGGATLADRALAILRATADVVVVVGHADGVTDTAQRVEDTRPGAGPLGALEALLCSGVADAYVVIPVDMPRLRAATLMRLRAALDADVGLDAAALAVDGEMRPLPLAVRARAAVRATMLLDDDDRRLRSFVAQLALVGLPIEHALREELVNVNTAADVALLSRL